MQKILLIDDDEKLAKLLAEYLRGFSFEVVAAHTASSGLAKLRGSNPALVLLDIMLPDASGLDLLREIRAANAVPVIMLTARGDVADKVIGLENGADDYVAKPFEPRELAARIASLVRRSAARFKVLRRADLEVHVEEHRVFLRGRELQTTAFEFLLLKTMLETPNKVFKRGELIAMLHGDEFSLLNRSLDVVINRLREKLGDDAKKPRYIKTIRGAGYAFVAN